MDPISARIPAFVSQNTVFGPQQTKGIALRFVVDPARPDWVAVCSPGFILWLPRPTLTAGLELRTVADDVSVRPYEAEEVTWLVIDVQRPSFPVSQISARLQLVQAFLLVSLDLLDFADPTLFERMVPRPFVAREVEHEWRGDVA